MASPLVYSMLRKAVAHVLLAKELDGILCSFEHLIVPLNTLYGGGTNDDRARVNQNVLLPAYKCGDNKLILPYKDIGTNDDDDDEKGSQEHFLYDITGKMVQIDQICRKYMSVVVSAVMLVRAPQLIVL